MDNSAGWKPAEAFKRGSSCEATGFQPAEPEFPETFLDQRRLRNRPLFFTLVKRQTPSSVYSHPPQTQDRPEDLLRLVHRRRRLRQPDDRRCAAAAVLRRLRCATARGLWLE